MVAEKSSPPKISWPKMGFATAPNSQELENTQKQTFGAKNTCELKTVTA
jgi:hypothetical protein